jgi:YidC/Oxa1 family membrane protein insertase
MDRSTTIGYVLIFLLFVGFFYFNQQNVEEIEQSGNQTDTTVVDSKVDEAKAAVADTTLSLDSTQITPSFAEKTETLSNDVLSVDFTNKGGIPSKVTIKNFKRYDSSELVLFENNQTTFNYTIPLANGTAINTQNIGFELSNKTDTSLDYTASFGESKIVQSYSLSKNSYKVGYSIRFIGFEKSIAPNNRFAELLWKTKTQLQEKSVEDERKVTTVYYKYETDDDPDNLSETSDDEETLTGSVKWVSFKQKFFNQTLIHDKDFAEDGIKISSTDGKDDSYIKDLSAQLYLPIESNDVIDKMSFYFGPNKYNILKKEGVGMQKMIPLGWGIFGWVNKLVVIPVFNWLEKSISNYGLIILLLTLIIKLALYFPMYKVYKSSAKMRLLKPELDEIKEKTGGDMQKMQQEQMKLYKQAGVSPLGGCLPQLIQIPILFAMFRFFPASIELRQKSLWWADDLSSYDSIYNFPGGFEIPFYGDHISLFTLMMTAVTLVYTYMNSQMTGQMVGPMKTVMYIMPVMFLGFFNNYAAALSFYYFLSTCITIIQNYIIRKFVIDEEKLHKQIQDSKKKKVNVKKSGLQKRLEDMAKKRGVDPYKGKPLPKKKK